MEGVVHARGGGGTRAGIIFISTMALATSVENETCWPGYTRESIECARDTQVCTVRSHFRESRFTVLGAWGIWGEIRPRAE